jgi:hypothetical protein
MHMYSEVAHPRSTTTGTTSLPVGDLDALGVVAVVELGADAQPGAGAG